MWTGVTCMVFAGFRIATRHWPVFMWESATATVVELHGPLGPAFQATAPRVTPRMASGGRAGTMNFATTLEFQADLSTVRGGPLNGPLRTRYRPGRQFTIYYDPDNPRRFVARDWMTVWAGPLIVGLIGLGIAAIGYFGSRRGQAAQSPTAP